MLTPDVLDHAYVAEVLQTRSTTAEVATRIASAAMRSRSEEIRGSDTKDVLLFHGYIPSVVPYHRATRRVSRSNGTTEEVPQTRLVGKREQFLYDLLVAQRGKHTVVAVPFHGLATTFFPKLDKALAGTRIQYERLNITQLVLRLGQNARASLSGPGGSAAEIGLTRCHLAYADEMGRSRNIQHVRITGNDLGATTEYQFLVRPVLEPGPRRGLVVTPIVLGFALFLDGVKKASAVTDRHGNFRVFIGAGLRQLMRLLDILDALADIEDVVTSTVNVPILQSRAIQEEVVD